MSNDGNSGYTKGFVIGAIIGGAVGAVTALLLAPKSGAELRKDLADKSSEIYNKATDYLSNVESNVGESVQNTVNEGKIRAQSIITSARRQAEDLLANAEQVLQEAKSKAAVAKDNIQEKYDTFRTAAKAGAEAFKNELKNPSEESI